MILPICSADDIRAFEREHASELADGTLMQRAAMAVATECISVFREHGRVVGRSVLLLVGSGDNGGDALFAGAMLARRGVRVLALPVSDRMHERGTAALRAAGGRVIDVDSALTGLADIDLVIDGIAGLGSARPLQGVAADIANAIDDAQLFTVAIDVPSGVHTDTGAVSGVAIHADVTVTFGALRRAHVVVPAALHCGEVLVADIGVPMASHDLAVTSEGRWFEAPDAAADKYARGVVGVVTGSDRYPGAALLSVGAAKRGGCGMVRFFGGARDVVVTAHPEVVPGDVSEITTARCNAWVVGCGSGTDHDAVAALLAVLARPEPAVVDADAITLLSRDESLPAALRARAERGSITVLTPHAAEMERLASGLGLDVNLAADRLGAAFVAARATGALVLLKGPSTLITDGQHFLATPLLGSQLATAGSGDVLAGLLASAMARWNTRSALTPRGCLELAAAAALRHAAAVADVDTTASDLLVGLDVVASATMPS